MSGTPEVADYQCRLDNIVVGISVISMADWLLESWIVLQVDLRILRVTGFCFGLG